MTTNGDKRSSIDSPAVEPLHFRRRCVRGRNQSDDRHCSARLPPCRLNAVFRLGHRYWLWPVFSNFLKYMSRNLSLHVL